MTRSAIAVIAAFAVALSLSGCATPEPETAEQRGCANAAELLPELDKAQAGQLSGPEKLALSKNVTATINNGEGEGAQVGAMLYVLNNPEDTATYADFREQLVTYCADHAEWPIE